MLKLVVLFSRAFVNSIVDLFSVRLWVEFFSSITTIDGLVFLACTLVPFYLWADGIYYILADIKWVGLFLFTGPFLIRWHLVICSRTVSYRYGLVEYERLPSRFRLFVWTALPGLGAALIMLLGSKFVSERLLVPLTVMALVLFSMRPLLRIYLSLYFSRNEIGDLLKGAPVDGEPIKKPGFVFLFVAALLLIASLGFYFEIGGLLLDSDFYTSNIYSLYKYVGVCSFVFWIFAYMFYGLFAANIYQGWVAEFNVDLLNAEKNVVAEKGVGVLDSFADKLISTRGESQRSLGEYLQAVFDGVVNLMPVGLNFCRSLSKGDYGLVKTFWVYGASVNLVAISVLTIVNSLVLNVILLVVFYCYTVLLLMGVWRAAANFAGPRLWGLLAELSCIFFALWLAVSLVMTLGRVNTNHPRVPQYITECDERVGDATKEQPDCIGEDRKHHHFPSSVD